MHIVHKRKDLTLEEAKVAKDGLAVLGFFIEAKVLTQISGYPLKITFIVREQREPM